VKCKRRATLLSTRQHYEQKQNTLQKHSKGKTNYTSFSCCEALYFTNDFPSEVDIGRMNIKCHHCRALHFQGE
ncbi:9792_t:CDS:1, partial [Dentiscutata erythropus]